MRNKEEDSPAILTTYSFSAPKIPRSFDHELISMSMLKFGDNSDGMLRSFEYIKWLFHKKTKNGYYGKRRQEGLETIKELEKTYEWIKTKEKELEAQEGHITQQLFYYVGGLSKKDKEVCRGFKYKRIPAGCTEHHRNVKVRKICQ
jgi:hypothetical protein